MADKSVGVNIDLQGNEAKNTRVENLAVIPSANPLTIGRLMYDTVSQRVYIDTGTQLYSLSAQFGTLLANKVLVTDANGFVSTDADFSWDTVNGQLVVKGGGTNPTDINITLTNTLAPVGSTIYVMGNGAMGFGVTPSLGDKINVNGKLRLSQSSGVGAGLQIDVLNAIIGGTNTPVAKLDLMGGDASRPTLFLQPQTPYIGTLTEGMAWNDNIKKSFIEQQSIGNKVLSGVINVSSGFSNTQTTGVATIVSGTRYSYTIPANTLAVGKIIRVYFSGRYKHTIATTWTKTLLINGVTVAITSAMSVLAGNNRGFEGWFEMQIESLGVGGTYIGTVNDTYYSTVGACYSQFTPNGAVLKSLDTTVANLLQIRTGFSNSNATLSQTFEKFRVEVLN